MRLAAQVQIPGDPIVENHAGREINPMIGAEERFPPALARQ
jgi:hypothetical protein